VLYVAPAVAAGPRAEFVSKLTGGAKPDRALYEQLLPLIGANGLLESVQAVWPTCHTEGHDLGKVIFARLKDLPASLKICQAGCYSGCMHGVVMEALTAGQLVGPSRIDRKGIGGLLHDLCRQMDAMTADYSPGDCAHGVGHALMVVTEYDVGRAIDGCRSAEDIALAYYCATGAYMEYVTERDVTDTRTKSWFYPCDSFAFSAACARYKMVHVARRHYDTGAGTAMLRQQCAKFDGAQRIGCFHGLGNAHMPLIAQKKVSLNQVCLGLADAEERACIDGAMERMAKFEPVIAGRVCEAIGGQPKKICQAAVARKMYDMNKDLTPYVTP
jgi:hypothetical protein